MNFRSNFRKRKTSDIGINITPLLDTVFILLIFFAVTTSFSNKTILDIDLVESSSIITSSDFSSSEVNLYIDENNLLYYNNTLVSISNLSSILSCSSSSGNSFIKYNVYADKRALYGTVVNVLDIGKDCGYSEVQLITKEKI